MQIKTCIRSFLRKMEKIDGKKKPGGKIASYEVKKEIEKKKKLI